MGSVKRLVFLFALATAACASSTPEPAVRVVFTQTPPELAFDPTDLRLRAAQAQLAELLGRPLDVDVDAALLPQWRGSFQHVLVAAIESVARDVRRLREEQRAAADAQLAKLTRVQCRYAATARSPRSELSADGATLTVYSTADAHDLLPRGVVFDHVARAYAAQKRGEYAKATPSSVPNGELDAYFADLSSRYDPGEKTPAESVRADAISRIIELEGRSRGTLRDSIRHFLAEGASSFFVGAYLHQAAAVRSYPAGSRFRRAERDFAGWVNRTQKALAPEDRLTLVRALYPRPFTQNKEPGRSFVTFAFPGVERDDILFDVLDGWTLAGHPMPSYGAPRGVNQTSAPHPKPTPLQEWVVCPRPKSPEGPRSLVPHCEDTLYQRAHEEPNVASRLLHVLTQKRDAVLTETVFANLAQSAHTELAISLWNRLGDARDDASWKVASAVLAEEMAATGGNALLVAEARKLYRTRERDRGTALYLLALSDRYAQQKIDWRAFPRSESPIRAADLSAFMQAGPHSVALLPTLWPALEANVKRADLILPAYDAFMTAEETRRYDMQDPWRALRSVHGALCRDGRFADVASIRSYYENRIRVDPEHARIYRDFIGETEPKICREDYEHERRGQRLEARSAETRR